MEHLNLPLDSSLSLAYVEAMHLCQEKRHEFLTPEHLLKAIIAQPQFQRVIESFDLEDSFDELSSSLDKYLDELDSIPEDAEDVEMEISVGMVEVAESLWNQMEASSTTEIGVPHFIYVLHGLDYYGSYLIKNLFEGLEGVIIQALTAEYETGSYHGSGLPRGASSRPDKKENWRDLVVCVNDNLDSRNPLIGREQELARTIQVLCRKDKNNPLHIGEPGVGKTAIVYGLARMIEDGKVPERLRGCKIYQIDMGSLVAGAQFRGQFEERIKSVMEGLKSEPGSILYIDEIHTIVGAGANPDQGVDAANQLKPYLESGDIRFIGSTTYEEYKRQFSKSKSLVRRFRQIDIMEPTVDEAIEILRQLRPVYEKFHGIRYSDEAIEDAVRLTSRNIVDRRLPDKAIDLIDEAGAYLELNPRPAGDNIVDKNLISETLARICRIETTVVSESNESEQWHTLTERVLGRVYGQDDAVRGVTEAVMMSKAGLTDPEKPIASMLFVGPTGVGKTEVALSLAEAMGVELVRFDMSEYMEKHAIAKLIGAPAGYVGYDDGGQLVDAIRKTPNCVLLLDEIEKAHPDIYNILLQVMDYGRLTDNKGNKADFRNVVLIMTSNAGAQFAAQASVGFGSSVKVADAMAREVKRLFKPEFINRLSAMVTFNSLDREMGSRILDKKLAQLGAMLSARNVSLNLSEEVRAKLLDEGVTRDHGARELDRVIAARLKPLLMREILFGTLQNGGKADVILTSEGLIALQ